MAKRETGAESESNQKPTVYVIAGPNGAGKTTFATEFLPHIVGCREFINADLIAAGLSPFDSETQNVRAGRLFIDRVAELRSKKKTFGFETTLSGRGYARLLRQMRREGYRIVLFFLWLPTVDIALSRVANRVQQGGHNIPEDDVRRRFESGPENLFRLYRGLLDEWWLFDGSLLPPTPVFHEFDGNQVVFEQALFDSIQEQATQP